MCKWDDDDDEDEEDEALAARTPSLNIDVSNAIDATCPKPVSALRMKLAKDIEESKDKLFIIRRQRPSHRSCCWHLVQVDEEETDWKRARQEGVHHVRYFIRSLKDSRKLTGKECAHWPEIHEFKRDGETMGPIVPTEPKKADNLLSTKAHRFMWCQDTFNPFDAMIAGPFDFESGHRAPGSAWHTLLQASEELDICVGGVNRVVPLDKPDREDTDVGGTPHSHMHARWNILTPTAF